MILIGIFTGAGGAGGEDRTGGGVHGSLPGHRGQHCGQGGRQDQVLSSLLLFVPSCQLLPPQPLSCLERLKEKSRPLFQSSRFLSKHSSLNCFLKKKEKNSSLICFCRNFISI